ncbi:ceramidase [Geopyxis carbonaria]|nr:ceramidase [Geopyxis carbonaria]
MSWEYARNAPSAWEPRTAKMNFCELDYYMTPYIAEFINTISNVSYLWLAWHGYRQCCRNGGNNTIKLGYALLAFVGIGSIVFHATLKYECQLIDELAMLYATALVLYAVFSTLLPPVTLGISLSGMMGSITYINAHTGGESLLHRVAFGAMIVTVGLRCMYLMTHFPDHRDNLRVICTVGSISFVSGFGLWLTDVFACETLLAWRDVVGWPLGAVLELHGWWHILTAYGVYYYIVFTEYLQVCMEGGDAGLEWTTCGLLPHVVRGGKATANGNSKTKTT